MTAGTEPTPDHGANADPQPSDRPADSRTTAEAADAPRRPRTVVLVRHGATDWSEALRHTGWTDVPLNQRGLRQVETLGPALRRWSFSAVLCSPLQRARQTCAAAGDAAGLVIDPDLREWHYGDYEGLTSTEIRRRRPGWTLWDNGVENGESLADVAGRAARVIERLRATEGDVAIFGHGHLLRVLAACWTGQAARLAQHLQLTAASISALGWEHDWPAIVLWNDAGHLRSAG